MDIQKRKLIKNIMLLGALAPFNSLILADELNMLKDRSVIKTIPGNFRYIYENTEYKAAFYQFLVNVFHLYPEADFHRLIEQLSHEFEDDKTIFIGIQDGLAEFKPFLSELFYALPALIKQKKLIAEQTASLLNPELTYDGYLELGSSGRYLDSLEEKFTIQGEKYFIAEKSPAYTPADILDRGQIPFAGQFQLLENYQVNIAKLIPSNSLDFVNVYIGFHHCPVDLRESFIGSIRDAMKPGASLIIRDHNAHNEEMFRMVALAHDVFNLGTNESWNYNDNELRLFYSLETLDEMMKNFGFKSDGTRLYQEGDPTLNALMRYTKV